MANNQFIVEVPNGDEFYWLADWSGDPGRTVLRENAQLFPSIAAAEFRLAFEQKRSGHYRESLFKAQIIKG